MMVEIMTSNAMSVLLDEMKQVLVENCSTNQRSQLYHHIDEDNTTFEINNDRLIIGVAQADILEREDDDLTIDCDECGESGLIIDDRWSREGGIIRHLLGHVETQTEDKINDWEDNEPEHISLTTYRQIMDLINRLVRGDTVVSTVLYSESKESLNL